MLEVICLANPMVLCSPPPRVARGCTVTMVPCAGDDPPPAGSKTWALLVEEMEWVEISACWVLFVVIFNLFGQDEFLE